jgi:hypothetical protein
MGERIGGKREGGEVGDDAVSPGGEEIGVICGGAQSEYAGTGGFAGADACGGVFDDETVSGREVEKFGAFEIRLRMGLAVEDVARSDEILRDRQTGGAQTNFSESASGGSDHGPAISGEELEQVCGAGESDEVGDVFDFEAFDFAVFGEVVGVG